MSLLDSWTQGQHTADRVTHPTYRKGSGPGIVLIHELPGMTADVIRYAESLVDAGYTVVMPHLFGNVPASMSSIVTALPKVCVNKEFNKLALGVTSPIATWLRSLARDLHGELGGPGVGALGMCFTGGFALAMMVDESVVAPVVAQPSLPFAIGRDRGADLGLSPADLDAVKRRATAGCDVLGLRYRNDPATGTRFDTLTSQIGDRFIRVELEGKGHSTLTAHRQQQAVDAVLAFFTERLPQSCAPGSRAGRSVGRTSMSSCDGPRSSSTSAGTCCVSDGRSASSVTTPARPPYATRARSRTTGADRG